MGAVMVYDDARRHVVLFGGRGAPGGAADYPNDLWAWDGQRWRELLPTDSVKPLGLESQVGRA